MDKDYYEIQHDGKRRRIQPKLNKDLPRYECFCHKQYLSYPALYLHFKKKHEDMFKKGQTGKGLQPGKLIQDIDPVHGYKVHKCVLDQSANYQNSPSKDPYAHNQPNYYGYKYPQNANPPYGYQPMGNQPYMDNYSDNSNKFTKKNTHQAQNKINYKALPVEKLFKLFHNHHSKRPQREKKDLELLLLLFIDCVNKNYEKLNDERTEGSDFERYSCNFNCDKIFELKDYFANVYLKEMETKADHFSQFFITHSQIFKEKKYSEIFDKIQDYIDNEKSRIIEEDPFSDQSEFNLSRSRSRSLSRQGASSYSESESESQVE